MHPETMYELVKFHNDELIAQAERERLARRAATGTRAGEADPIRFRDRVARIFGAGVPSASTGSTRPAGA
jgi:hypothetical protein